MANTKWGFDTSSLERNAEDTIVAIYLNPNDTGLKKIRIPSVGKMSIIRKYIGGPVQAMFLEGNILYIPDKESQSTVGYSQVWNFPDGEKMVINGPTIIVGYDTKTKEFKDATMEHEDVAQICQFVDPDEALEVMTELAKGSDSGS